MIFPKNNLQGGTLMIEKMIPAFAKAQGGLFGSVAKAVENYK